MPNSQDTPNSEETLFPAAADNLDQSHNWLVGVIDQPRRAEHAAQALRQAGFAEDDVLLLQGPDALRRLEAKDEQRNLLGWAHKALAQIVTDAGDIQSAYAHEASAGHAIINVHTREKEDLERARTLLTQHGAHYIKHFGVWTIADLD